MLEGEVSGPGVVTQRDEISDGITFFQLANAVLRNRWVFLLLPPLFAAAAVLLNQLHPRMYAASASFVSNSAPNRSQFASLAQELGLPMNVGDAGQSPAFYGSLLKTRDILQAVVETPYVVTEEGRERTATLLQLYEVKPDANRSATEQALETVRQAMYVRVEWETGIVRLSFRAEQPELAEQVASRLIQLMQEFDISKRRTQASARRRFAQERYEEARSALRAAEATLDEFVTSNRLFQMSPVLTAAHSKLVTELLLRQQLYAAMAQAYEQARIDEVRDTPVITVLENPEGSAVPQPRGTVLKAILGLVLGFVTAIFIALFRESARRARASRDTDFQEFTVLVGDLNILRRSRRRPAYEEQNV